MDVIDLAAARAAQARGLCLCGSGVFSSRDGGENYACAACGRARLGPAQAPPKLALRCGCGSCLFLVGLRGVECAACGRETGFLSLFDAGPP